MRALRDAAAGRCAGLLAALLLTGVAAPAPAARFDFDTTPGRLPKDVVPTLYRLTLELDPAAATFSGRAQIEVDVRRPVTWITVNALRLSARSVRLQGTGRRMSPAEQVAVIIREKSALRQREGAAAAAAGSGRKKETVPTR